MTMETNSDYHQRGLELAEAGRHQEALVWIQKHLESTSDDAEVMNDAGAILHCLGRSEEAIAHFTRALELRKDSGEILWNLVEAYLAVGKARAAVGLFDDMQRLNILNPDVINRTATALVDQGDKGGAVEVLLRSLQNWPDQEVLNPMLDFIRSKRPKIAFSAAETA